MSKRYPGALITKTPVVPTSLSAPGIWSLSDQAAAQATNTWPFPRDPQFKNVTMLLHGDGSGGPTNLGMGAGASPTVTNFNADASTNNFNVTINGDAKSNNFNPYQAGYYSNYFDGTGDYLTVPDNAVLDMGSSDFTIEGWVFLSSTGSSQTFVAKGTGAGNQASYHIVFNGTNWLYYLSGNGSTWSIASGVTMGAGTANTWQHLALVRSGSTFTPYVNGTAGTTTSSATALFDSTNVFSIGADDATNQRITGYISNCRVVKGTAVYTSAFTPSTTPLTAITNTVLLTCQSNRFIDNSTNAFTLTKNGDTAVSPAQPFTLPSSVATYGSGYFDGSGDGLTSATSSAFAFGTGDFTYEGYYYSLDTGNSLRGMFDTRASQPSTAGILMREDNTGILVYVNGGTLFSVTGRVPNTWQHIALVRQSGTIRLYINGVQATSASSSQNFTDTYCRISGFIDTQASPYGYFGYISNARVVKGTCVYPNGTTFTPPTAPLTAITNTSLLTTQYNGGGNNSGFKDSSQFNFPITRNGNTTQGTFTPYGSNWSNFIGSSNYLTSPTSSNLLLNGVDSTIEGWYYLNAAPGGIGSSTPFFAQTNTSNTSTSGASNFWCFSDATTVYFSGSNETTNLTFSASLLPINQWFHLAWVITSGTSAVIYLNGTSVASGSINAVGSTATYFMLLGAVRTGGGTFSYLNGYISNFRIVKGSKVYNSAFTPSTTPLTAISGTQFLTCQTNRFSDASSNAFAITTTGSPSVQRFSPFSPTTAYSTSVIGGSGYFDGSGDYLSIADANALDFAGDFTIEYWFYLTGSLGADRAVLHKSDTNVGYELVITSGNKVSGNCTSLSIASSTSIVANTWNHVALVRSGSGTNNVKLYLNGVQENQGTNTNNTATAITLGVGAVARSGAAGVNPFPGYLSNVRTVASAVYTSAFTPSTAPLTAITNTSLLLNYTNAGILDNAMMNDLETVGNAQISTSVKKYGTGSMYFDGSGDYLTVPSTPNLAFGGNFTVEAWLYLTSYPSSANAMYVCDFRNGSTSNFGFGVIGSAGVAKPYAFVGSGPVEATGSTSLSLNTWYHIAMVRSGSTVTYYLNGVSDATMTTSFSQGATGVTVGARYTGSTEYVAGYIDDLRITKGVARYTANFTVPNQAFPNG